MRPRTESAGAQRLGRTQAAQPAWLEQDFGAPFGHYNTANLALPLLALLRWQTHDDYVADMRRFETDSNNLGNAQ